MLQHYRRTIVELDGGAVTEHLPSIEVGIYGREGMNRTGIFGGCFV